MFRSIYILRKLSHPNIGNMLCLYAENPDVQAFDTFYAILDYDGLTLRNVLDHEHPLSIRCVLEIVTQTVVGLAYIHSFAVAHGELNPSSLILVNRRSNRVHASGNPKWKSFLLKITGFGKYPLISMDQTQDVDDAAKAYRAPEVITQWSTFKTQSDACAVDIFSFGLIVTELITGRVPMNLPHDLAIIEEISGLY